MSFEFDRLLGQFSRARSLPELPGSAVRLVSAIDTGEASAIDLERIINGDPGLATNLLRIANSSTIDRSGVTTTRAAIMRMGQNTVRSLAVSLVVQGMVSDASRQNALDTFRFAKHSIFVAFLSRFLFQRVLHSTDAESKLHPDEIFAGGMLHDLSVALLSKVSPEQYQKIAGYGKRSKVSLNEAFQKLYGEPLGKLGEVAALTWVLPSVFLQSIRYASEPFAADSEQTAMACLNFANWVASNDPEYAIEDWEFENLIDPRVSEIVKLEDEELQNVVEMVGRHTEAYLPDANTKAA